MICKAVEVHKDPETFCLLQRSTCTRLAFFGPGSKASPWLALHLTCPHPDLAIIPLQNSRLLSSSVQFLFIFYSISIQILSLSLFKSLYLCLFHASLCFSLSPRKQHSATLPWAPSPRCHLRPSAGTSPRWNPCPKECWTRWSRLTP